MNRKTKEKIGIAILITGIIGYAALANKLGGLIYPITLLLTISLIIAVVGYKYPKTRPFIYSILTLIWDSLSAVFSQNERDVQSEKRVVIPKIIRPECRDRDESCKYPDCSYGLDVCDLHHIDQDNTNSKVVSNLIHLCTNHHRTIHDTNKKPVLTAHINQLKSWTKNNYTTQYQKPIGYGFGVEPTTWYKKVRRTIIEEEEIGVKK